MRSVAIAIVVLLLDGLARPMSAPAQTADAKELLKAVVGVKAKLSPDDPSAAELGVERSGSGVVIDAGGLVLTIGYIMRRAETVRITLAGGRTVPAEVVGNDDDSGFGLLRALEPLDIKPVRLGDTANLKEGDRVLAVSFAELPDVTAARVFARHSYAGPWEYLIDDAIFTAPVHQNFGGAALLGEEGTLLGIGSLFVNVGEPIALVPGNMFVPVDLLKPVLGDLLANKGQTRSSRPWLGIRTKDSLGTVVVTSVVEGSPGAKAGIDAGDIIVGVKGKRVTTMVEFFRQAWALGGAGTVVPLDVVRAKGTAVAIERIDVTAVDRNERYRSQRKRGL